MNDDFIIDWGTLPLIPEGIYEAVYVQHEVFNQNFGPKVKITFRITSLGEYNGTFIAGWYNIKKPKSGPGRGKAAFLSRHSKLVTELLRVLDVKVRVDRLSPAMLKPLLLKIRVRTVRANSKQKELHKFQQYSTCDSIVGSLTSNMYGPPQINPLLKPEPKPEPAPT